MMDKILRSSPRLPLHKLPLLWLGHFLWHRKRDFTAVIKVPNQLMLSYSNGRGLEWAWPNQVKPWKNKLRSETKVRGIQSSKLSHWPQRSKLPCFFKNSEPNINVDNASTIYKQNVAFQLTISCRGINQQGILYSTGHCIYIISVWACVPVGTHCPL